MKPLYVYQLRTDPNVHLDDIVHNAAGGLCEALKKTEQFKEVAAARWPALYTLLMDTFLNRLRLYEGCGHQDFCSPGLEPALWLNPHQKKRQPPHKKSQPDRYYTLEVSEDIESYLSALATLVVRALSHSIKREIADKRIMHDRALVSLREALWPYLYRNALCPQCPVREQADQKIYWSGEAVR